MSVDDVMQRYYTAYNTGDVDQVSSVLDEQVRLNSAAGEQIGRESYLDTYRYMTSQFIDQMTPQAITVIGDTATVRIENVLTARHDIPDFFGHPMKAGQVMTLRLVGRYVVKGDLITEIEIAFT